MTRVVWTEAADVRLKELWAKGLDDPEIAAELAREGIGPFTRITVLKHRAALGLSPNRARGNPNIGERANSASWPTEHIDALRAMEGSTAGQMLAEIKRLRPDATRSAVIGQCRRHNIKLSLLTRGAAKIKSVADGRGGKRLAYVATAPRPPKAPPVDADAFAPLPGVEPILLMARTASQCPWPVGEEPEQLRDLKCCGAPRRDADAPYCAAHMNWRRDKRPPRFLKTALQGVAA